MITFSETLDTNRESTDAFELLADMTDLHLWNPNVSESRRVSGSRFEVGSRYESIIVRGPIRLKARSTLIALERGRMVRYEGPITGVWSVDSLTFTPLEDGTSIKFANESTVSRWLRFAEPAINALFQRQAPKAVVGARRYLSG